MSLYTTIQNVVTYLKQKLSTYATTYYEIEQPMTSTPFITFQIDRMTLNILTISRRYEITLHFDIFVVAQDDNPEVAKTTAFDLVGKIIDDLRADYRLGGNCYDSFFRRLDPQYLERATTTRHQIRIQYDVILHYG